MANLQITHDDLIATLEAQRNEAWNAAARTGAALSNAGRQIDALEKELAEAKAQLSDLKSGPGSGHEVETAKAAA